MIYDDDDDDKDESVLNFYTFFAMYCYSDAQYLLAKLYLLDRFYDEEEYAKWIHYAAFMGHKDAIRELGELDIDELWETRFG